MYVALIWLGFGIAAIFLAGMKGFSLAFWGLPCLLLGPAPNNTHNVSGYSLLDRITTTV